MLEKLKFKYPQFFATLKQQWFLIVLILVAVSINLFTLFKHNPVTTTPTVVTKVDTVYKDKEVIRYIESFKKESDYKKEIIVLQKKLESYQLQSAELKSLLNHQKNAKGQIKYFGKNASVDSVLKRISSITSKNPIKTGVSN